MLVGVSVQVARWRVPREIVVLKIAGAAAFGLLALAFAGQPPRMWVALAAAAALGLFAVRDLIAPVRLAADAEGVTVVHGYAGRRRLAWAEIERIRIDERRRLGLRTALLEIDTGGPLYLFSSAELGARCEDVAERLRSLRTGH